MYISLCVLCYDQYIKNTQLNMMVHYTFAGKIVRSRGRDGFLIRRGHVKREVPTSIHGHLVIDFQSIPYSSLSSGFDVGSHQALSHSSTPSSSSVQHFRFSRTLSTLSPIIYMSSPYYTPDPLLHPTLALPIHSVSTPTLHYTWPTLMHLTYVPLV